MKVLVDENIPLITVEELRLKGFDVSDIRGSAEQGITDEVLWQKAQQEKNNKGQSLNSELSLSNFCSTSALSFMRAFIVLTA